MSEKARVGKQVPIEKLEAGKWYWALPAEGLVFAMVKAEGLYRKWEIVLKKEREAPIPIFVLDTTFEDILIYNYEYKGIRCLHEELIGYALVQNKRGDVIYDTFYEMEDSGNEGS